MADLDAIRQQIEDDIGRWAESHRGVLGAGVIRLDGVAITGMAAGFGSAPAGAVLGTVIAVDGDAVTVDLESPSMAAERMTREAAD